MTPIEIFKAAMRAVPSLKYALAVLGIVSAIAIIKGFGIDYQVAVFGTVIMLVLMSAMVVFAALTRVRHPQIKWAALILMWSFLGLTIASATLLFTSAFFAWPKPLPKLLTDKDALVKQDQTPVNNQQELTGALEIKVTEPGNSLRKNVMLDQELALPLRPGDLFEYTADVKPHKAYLYVIYLNSDGTVTPLFPWEKYDWKERPTDEPRDHLYQKGAMNAGPTGVESLVLLVRETPLPANIELATVIGDLPRQQNSSDPLAFAWFENGALLKEAGQRAAPSVWQKADDPIPLTQALLHDRLRTLFPYTRAVCFAFQGTEPKRGGQ